eukprot:gnl/TRDRNA2_/TRDRNA2_174742_c0_seq15.p1 gnl/TRDRNA2_/TRDRNA2_174742_c0~~gnl/TRDRNA2_/TRDRNA2_174742_c0_seq15.p1  ORF type:complete len:352 (-),score=97.91 gnl/TRDRNA2_/TRDRNA2_174742_c0_seq15:147-1202(-)
MASAKEEERRLNPEDQKAYTLKELLAKFAGHYGEEEIVNFWRDEMTPVVQPKVPKTISAQTTEGAASSCEDPDSQEERRRDPLDGRAYTFQELKAQYEGQYTINEVKDYWLGTMVLVEANHVQQKQQQQQPQQSAQMSTLAQPSTAAESQQPLTQGNAWAEEWLRSMDESRVLEQYADRVACQCTSLEAALEMYSRVQGSKRLLDPRFFDDVGIKKVGHKRMVERYFDTIEVKEQASAIQDLPVEVVEEFYRSPGEKLCEAGAAGDPRSLSVLLALCDLIDVEWRTLQNEVGETLVEAAGSAGNVDLAKALIREGARPPLAAVIAYGDVSELDFLLYSEMLRRQLPGCSRH